MIIKGNLAILYISLLISAGCFRTSEILCIPLPSKVLNVSKTVINTSLITGTKISKEVDQLNASLKNMLLKGDYTGGRIIVDRISMYIRSKTIDTRTVSNSFYLIGVYYSLTGNLNKAIDSFKRSAVLKAEIQEYDNLYARTLFNLGILYGRLGDFTQLENYSLQSLEIEKKLFGENSPDLISTYSGLITAYIELKDYDNAVYYSNISLSIVDNNPGKVSPSFIVTIYNNLGVCFNRLADFSKARIYLEKSESIHHSNHISSDEDYINLMNNLAIAYGALGLSEKSDKYYEKGISKALSENSPIAYNMINSYAIILGNRGKKKKGEALLHNAAINAKNNIGEDSRSYFVALNNYADYLREYEIDNTKALEYYTLCLEYLRWNKQDHYLRTSVFTGYSLSLAKSGESEKALETIQSLLFSEIQQKEGFSFTDNPPIDFIKPEPKSLKVLRSKYSILWNIYNKTYDQETLVSIANTSELVVSLIEKIRINISEEESRLVLGDRYRDSYLHAIRDFNLLYSETADRKYLEKAFEYSEKSKVAGLLASTRELKASQFHIPENIADLERNIKRDINLFNARLAEVSVKENADTSLIEKWKDNLLDNIRIRDSLILFFEREYPGYYAIKYNTQVAKLNDVARIIGHNGNYINYIVSDTILYAFLVNRKHQHLFAIPVDSSFFNYIRQFRNLLSMPLPSDNARIIYTQYQSVGYELYLTLFAPFKKYLISNNILISPDNALSYIPFETIPSSKTSDSNIIYRNLAYLMKDFDISYTYSATFLAESENNNFSFHNSAIAFAPDYLKPIDITSVLMNLPEASGVLEDLPFARQEAAYISEITGGKLYLGNEAKESAYKLESGKFDIIHLAMHTILNDKNPMHSMMVFSSETDTVDDGFLKTFEVYETPLKAKMIVLSSCNTGAGMLFSGEGILSLARGFIYSGSQSVVMSMWEIEDRSGTEIVRLFYGNLKKGLTKSSALRKARMKYLKNADQLRSHPYYWSSLVIYGNNSPLYYSKYLILFIATVILIIAVPMIIYFRKLRYS